MSRRAFQRRDGHAATTTSVVIPSIRETRELWIANRKRYRNITKDSEKFYGKQSEALGAAVGEDSPVTDTRMEDIEGVLLDIRQRDGNPSQHFGRCERSSGGPVARFQLVSLMRMVDREDRFAERLLRWRRFSRTY